jgi:hypothetical protein
MVVNIPATKPINCIVLIKKCLINSASCYQPH